MELDLDFFHNEWIPRLEESAGKVKGALIMDIIPTSAKFSTVTIAVSSYSDLYLIGFWAGFNSAEDAFDEAMPQVVENINEYIDKLTNQSQN